MKTWRQYWWCGRTDTVPNTSSWKEKHPPHLTKEDYNHTLEKCLDFLPELIKQFWTFYWKSLIDKIYIKSGVCILWCGSLPNISVSNSQKKIVKFKNSNLEFVNISLFVKNWRIEDYSRKRWQSTVPCRIAGNVHCIKRLGS